MTKGRIALVAEIRRAADSSFKPRRVGAKIPIGVWPRSRGLGRAPTSRREAKRDGDPINRACERERRT